MPKKRDHIPANIDELEKTFYGPNKDGENVDLARLKRYLDYSRTKVTSPALEDDAKEFFAPLGILEKIPENPNQTTFDYKMDSHKILLDVTSLNMDETSPKRLSKEETLTKISTAINHILVKDGSQFLGYRKGAVIVYSLIFNFFSGFNRLLDGNFPKMAGLFDNDLDFVVFFHEPASVNDTSSWERYPPVIYVKRSSMLEVFKQAFCDCNYRIIPVY